MYCMQVGARFRLQRQSKEKAAVSVRTRESVCWLGHPGKVSNCVPRAICGDSESVKLQLSMTNLSQLAGADSGQNSFPRSHWSLLSTSILQLSERKFYFFMLCAENSTKFVKQWRGHKLGVCYPLKAPAQETPCVGSCAYIFREKNLTCMEY